MSFVKNELQKKGVTVSDTDVVKVVVKPYLSVKVKNVETEGVKEVSAEIAMLYDVEVLVNGTPVKLVDGGIVADSSCKPMELTIVIANHIFSESEVKEQGGIYVEHRKADGTVYRHDATLKDGENSEPDRVTFLNDKGYSLFTVKLKEKTVDKTTTPAATGSSSSQSGSNKHSSHSSSAQQTGSAATGDTTNIWLPLCILVGAGIGICVIWKRKKKED